MKCRINGHQGSRLPFKYYISKLQEMGPKMGKLADMILDISFT